MPLVEIALEDARSLLWETDKSFHIIVCLSPSNCCQLSLYYCHGNNCLGHSGRTVHCPVLELHPFSESTATICGDFYCCSSPVWTKPSSYYQVCVAGSDCWEVVIKCHWWKLLNPLLLEDARSLLWETDKSFHSIVCLSPSNCCQLSLYYCHGNNYLGHSGRTVHCPVLELHPFSESTATICEERHYIGGGFTTGANGTESVVMCEVKDLLQSQPQSLATRLLGRRSVWNDISPLPVILSFLVTFQGQLLAV